VGSLTSENSLTSQRPLKGLMYHIGNVEQNLLGAETCLEFLAKLIDYEYNPECEAYIYILKTTKMEDIHAMKLSTHLQSKRNSIIQCCYRILKAMLNDDKQILQKLRKILIEQELVDKFLDWLDFGN
jgi:hypothetical protein